MHLTINPSNSVQSPTTVDPSQRKLKKAAQDFESILLANWLEKMQANVGVPGGEETDSAHDNLSSMAVQMAASGIASAGGLGIARMLLRSLHTPGTTNVTTEAIKDADSPADSMIGGGQIRKENH